MRENGVTKEGERKRFLLFAFRRQKSMRQMDGNEVAGQRRIAWRDTLVPINGTAWKRKREKDSTSAANDFPYRTWKSHSHVSAISSLLSTEMVELKIHDWKDDPMESFKSISEAVLVSSF